jgi:hypothetical protein
MLAPLLAWDVNYMYVCGVSSEGGEGSTRCTCYDIILPFTTSYKVGEHYLLSIDVLLPIAWYKNAAEIFSSNMSSVLIL